MPFVHVLIIFNELLISACPYQVVTPSDLENESASTRTNKRTLLKRAVALDCNQVERLGTLCLLVFLGCTSVFQDRSCRGASTRSVSASLRASQKAA